MSLLSVIRGPARMDAVALRDMLRISQPSSMRQTESGRAPMSLHNLLPLRLYDRAAESLPTWAGTRPKHVNRPSCALSSAFTRAFCDVHTPRFATNV
eukprot:6183039-Pleurochrysis_carterae.AAC.2